MKDTQNYDVIIAGGGPVGLFLACELALAHCTVLVLEKSKTPDSPLKKLPFGIRGLSAPTIETLARRGLLKELEIHKHLKNPHQPTTSRRQAGHFAGIAFYEEDVDISQWPNRLPGSTPPSLISEIAELETVFTRRADSLGVEIIRGAAITAFEQNADEVIVRAGHNEFKCKWLVGCDGSRSVVRKLGGFEFAGTEPEFTGYSTKVDLADPEKLKPGRNVTERGMYLQSQPGYIMLQDFDAGAFHASEKPITVAHLQEVLRRISNTDVTITALHAATSWTDRARQATSYRKGRVLLAGDAAHIHSPLGGQGLNLGLGDVINLGWKLAATINDTAPEDLLDTYYAERYPLGEQVLDWSRAQVAVMKPNAAGRALHGIFRDVIATRDGATYFASRVWGIFSHYDLKGHHPLVGYSVPNFETETGKNVDDAMHNGKGVFIDFTANKNIEYILKPFQQEITFVSQNKNHQNDVKAVLVRPDGVVAWASDVDPYYDELKLSISRWWRV